MKVLPPLLALLFLFLMADSAAARTFYVDAGGNTPYQEIQDAIDAASSGDLIQVFPGTYGPVDFSGKDLVVRSTGGPSLTVIDGGGLGPAVTFNDEEGSGALLHGFLVSGGTGRYEESIDQVAGGGIYVGRGATPRISANVVSGNTATLGGGIAAVSASPQLYGNTILQNTATATGGGLWLQDLAGGSGETLVACNSILGNEGGQVGGLLLGSGSFSVLNNVLVGNEGERGGLWALSGAMGSVHNNTLVANSGSATGAGGLESESATLAFRNNILAFSGSGWGAVRASSDAVWAYNVLWANAAGEYSGAAGDPTGSEGNFSLEPAFVLFTPADATDDDLQLVASSPLWDMGDPDPAFNDPDGSRNAVGADGGLKEGCDIDADGERPTDPLGDCLPEDGNFVPLAYEVDDGLDSDCDGWATFALADFVLDDGGLSPVSGGLWDFGLPISLPGEGYQGTEAWCTGVGGAAPASSSGALVWTHDLSGYSLSSVRLILVHAYDSPNGLAGGLLAGEASGSPVALLPEGGYPGSLDGSDTSHPLMVLAGDGLFSGDSGGWVTSNFSLDGLAGSADASLSFHYGAGSSVESEGLGWTLGRAALAVEDADGDGRGAWITDCDDSDASRYQGAPELPYDGIDQDCDGADLVDVDGDGFVGVGAGGDDCLDEDPASYPGASEQAYDGIDQDCSGGDLVDVDGDGVAGIEAGGEDCDDGDSSVYPDAEELPYDGVDQDCDGEDLVDVDADGYAGEAGGGGDCDDQDPKVHPEAWELCDTGVDEDCDGIVDQHPDLDGDGFDLCGGDCNEGQATTYPGAIEACDGADTDCDGDLPVDEVDEDEDGQRICEGDCDDADALKGLGFQEICDLMDNNCDGLVDEGHDLDGDGFSSCDLDCDDQLVTFSPEAEPDCQSVLDHDCNGQPDFEQDDCSRPQGCSGCQGRIAVGDPAGQLAMLVFCLALALRSRSLRWSGSGWRNRLL